MKEQSLIVSTGNISEMGNWNQHSLPAAYRLVVETFDLVAGQPIDYKVRWFSELNGALKACREHSVILDREVQTSIFHIAFGTGRHGEKRIGPTEDDDLRAQVIVTLGEYAEQLIGDRDDARTYGRHEEAQTCRDMLDGVKDLVRRLEA